MLGPTSCQASAAAPQQAARASALESQQYDVSGLMEVLRKPDNADGDEVNRDDIVQDARHQQDENSSNERDQWVE